MHQNIWHLRTTKREQKNGNIHRVVYRNEGVSWGKTYIDFIELKVTVNRLAVVNSKFCQTT